MTDEPLHVIVVGGGIAGVACANRLAGEPQVRATLVDRNEYHQFQPLLYQVASAELAAEDVRFDLVEMFEPYDNVTVRIAEVVSVDPAAPSVTFADGETLYGDVVVVGAGAQPNFFHTPGAPDHSFPLYSVDDAVRVRARVLQLYAEAAERPELADEGALTFVVIGGGPTGVETAGALAELVHEVMPHHYPELDGARAQVILVDLAPGVLGAFSAKAHDYAADQLRHRRVHLKLGVSAREVAPDRVTLSDGTVLPTRLVIWGGGEKAAQVAGRAGVDQGHGGRIDVRPDLSVEGYPHLYAVGDVANVPNGDAVLPQLGSVAAQSGDWAARNVMASIEHARPEPFVYRDKGIMAMIGRRAAIAEIGEHRHELHGRMAFAAWLGVHAELLANAGAELRAFTAWAEEFYLRPHHRSRALLDKSTVDTPRIRRTHRSR
ncbi:MAG TPA: NAD(P)/FAD-dependent oxidoreductase [Asanoa sp.]